MGLYIPEAGRSFDSLEEYVAWHKEKHKKRFKEAIPKGDRHYKAKITDAQVVEIRRAYYSGQKGRKQLAEEYGLSHSALGYLLTGESWGHIREGLEQYEAEKAQYTTPEEIAAWRHNRKVAHLAKGVWFKPTLSEDTVRAIRAEYEPGKVLMKHLAEKYDVKIATVSDILNRRTWKHI
jgi:hypothetical protein